jgi:hypothetical protein
MTTTELPGVADPSYPTALTHKEAVRARRRGLVTGPGAARPHRLGDHRLLILGATFAAAPCAVGQAPQRMSPQPPGR